MNDQIKIIIALVVFFNTARPMQVASGNSERARRATFALILGFEKLKNKNCLLIRALQTAYIQGKNLQKVIDEQARDKQRLQDQLDEANAKISKLKDDALDTDLWLKQLEEKTKQEKAYYARQIPFSKRMSRHNFDSLNGTYGLPLAVKFQSQKNCKQ